MKRQVFIVLSIMLSAFLGATMVWAQQKGTIELNVVAEMEKEVVKANGDKEIIRVPVARAVPGDEIVYTLHYTNTGQEPADNVVITDPIPEHMIYVQGSASGADAVITFSVDNGQSYDLPERLTITGTDGNIRPARASDYTHIRWVLRNSLPANQKGQVFFRARLE
jgi:uncharacterized repeat protein (TIGR01451 family)